MIAVGNNQVVFGAVRHQLVPEDDGLSLRGHHAVVIRRPAHEETALVGARPVRIAVIPDHFAVLVFLSAPDVPLPEGGSLVIGARLSVQIHPHARLVGSEFRDFGAIGIHAVEAVPVQGPDRIDGIVSYGWFVSYELLKSNTWLWLMTNMEKLLCKE